MTAGAVAAGNPDTVRAGLFAFEQGGNAVDAVIAASLMACISESMLTGLAGAGIAILSVEGKQQVCDFFTAMPGLDRQSEGEGRDPSAGRKHIDIDFGPTTQRFTVGPGTVAVPTLPFALAALHERYAVLPMKTLATPAIDAARNGVVIQPGFATILNSLWEICQLSDVLTSIMGTNGRPLRAGEKLLNPALADTIERFAEDGDNIFRTGDIPRGMMEAMGNQAALSHHDLMKYQVRFLDPIQIDYRDAKLWLTPPPSASGLLLAHSLLMLKRKPIMPDLNSTQLSVNLIEALSNASHAQQQRFFKSINKDGFIDGFLSAISRKTLNGVVHTTHISTADQHGNVIGITTSLGETSGIMDPRSGIVLNNFLGEDDVNPPSAPTRPGQRLMTMCCPTILKTNNQDLFVMGSGGSSRIRSALIHGIVALTDYELTPTQAVLLPRCHADTNAISVELEGKHHTLRHDLETQFKQDHRTLTFFEKPNMFFGGLNISGIRHTDSGVEFLGAGDPLRSGAFETCTHQS